MKKMSVSELHNLSEINHLRTPNLMISVSSSFKYSERTPMKTESNDLKKFQRKSIKKNMKIIKSTKILSSK